MPGTMPFALGNYHLCYSAKAVSGFLIQLCIVVKLVMKKCFLMEKKPQARDLSLAEMKIWVLCHKFFSNFEVTN